MSDTVGRTPLVLVVDDEEWTLRSIESMLNPRGFAVLKAFTGQQALHLSNKVRPDALIVERHLPDMTGVAVVGALRNSPAIRPSTPILMLTAGPAGREERQEALRAGAWDLIRPPFDSEELTLQLEVFLRAKEDADAARQESLVDPLTGFYNVKGLLKRLDEVTAGATRHRRPLACVFVGPDRTNGADETEPAVMERSRAVSRILSDVARVSDVIGKVGDRDFVIVAPDTDESGASRLAERILEAVEGAVSTDGNGGMDWAATPLRAGFCAVADARAENANPADLLTRAKLALRQAQKKSNGLRINPYQPQPK